MKMKKIIQLVFILFLSCTTLLLKAQSAENIVDNYIEACGGKDALSRIKTIVYSGQQDYYGQMESLVITEVEDSLQRYDINVNGQKGLWMINKEFMAEFYPWETNAKKPSINQMTKLKPGFKILDKLMTYKKDGSKIDFLGEFKTDSALCYKIQLIAKDGPVRYYWFDKTTKLLIQSSVDYGMRTSQNDRLKSMDVTRYSSWQKVDDMLFPFASNTEVIVNRKIIAKKSTVWSSIQINNPVASALYKAEIVQ